MLSHLLTKALVTCLALSAVVFSQTASISGVVSDRADSDPIAGAQVILREGSSGGSGGGRVWTPIDTVTTSVSGSYRFSNLDAGTYQVAASATGYTSTTSQVTLTAAQAATTNVELTASTGAATLAVFVGKSVDSTAIADASVSASSGGGHATPITGVTTSGGWAIFTETPAGTYSITATANGFAVGIAQVTVESAGSDTARVYLGPAASDAKVVKGTVKDSRGVAVRALVTLTSGTGDTRITLTDSTDQAGAYLIAGIPATYTNGRVSASATGYASDEQQTSLSADTTTINFVLTSLVTAARAVSPKETIATTGMQRKMVVVNVNGRLLGRRGAGQTHRGIALVWTGGVTRSVVRMAHSN